VGTAKSAASSAATTLAPRTPAPQQ
jgi:hypothetical protein